MIYMEELAALGVFILFCSIIAWIYFTVKNRTRNKVKYKTSKEKSKIKKTMSILDRISIEIRFIKRNDLIKYGIMEPYVFENVLIADRGMTLRYNSNYIKTIFEKLINDEKRLNPELVNYLEKFEKSIKDKNIFAIFIYWESGYGFGSNLYAYRKYVVGNRKRALDFLKGGYVEWLV